MSTNPTTSETSLKTRPALRVGLIALWIAIVGYTVLVLGIISWPKISSVAGLNLTQTILAFPSFIQLGLDLGVDFLIMLTFAIIAGLLVLRRSDDWFAIFTSLFLITFGARLTDNMNTYAAVMSGYQTLAGIVLALGEIGVILFLMLFPDGKFTPGWAKFTIPLLVIFQLAIYTVPDAPFFWVKLQASGIYFWLTTAWYMVGFLAFIYRYAFHANLAQKQQIRWVLIGVLGPFVWYLLYSLLHVYIPNTAAPTSLLTTSLYAVLRILGLFMFPLLPLSITVSIVRSKLFDIDLIINRSLVYGALTFALVLGFGGMLAIVSLLFKSIHQGDQSLLVATVFSVAAGALFQPARKRLQRFVDRVFYHIEIDYQKTPAELPARAEASTGITALSSYRELKLIARGGMSEVYRATSPTNGKSVAIKILPASLATDDQFRKRFLREAQIVSGLEHTNIVRILDFGDEAGAYYIVMEYLSGPDLSNLLKQEKRITLPAAINLLRDVGAALDYAHGRGLVHRDIKPSNVMMDSASGLPRAVLTDFGIAKITDAHTRITVTGVLGTFDYIAPEQIQASAEVDSRADLYALGVMTYQMLTGHLPFERPNTGALLLAHISAPPPDARELVPELPRHAAYAIQRIMAKKPKDRYASAAEFVLALESA